MTDKYIPWEDIKIGMEVLYVGPGGDSGFIGCVVNGHKTEYIILNGERNNLYILNAKNHLYFPDSSLDDVDPQWLKQGTKVYDEYGNVFETSIIKVDDKNNIMNVKLYASTGTSFITRYPELYYFRPPGSPTKASTKEKNPNLEYNTTCPKCGAPAYQGLFRVECSKGCC